MNYINKYFIYIILGVLVLRFPNGMPFLERIFDYSIVLCYILSLIFVIDYFRLLDNKEKFVFILLTFLPAFLLLSRFINGFPISRESIIRGFLYPSMLINLFSVIIKKDMWDKLKAIDFVLMLFVVINFLTVVFYPDGWYSTKRYDLNWFLGYKNVMIRSLLPAITINCLVSFHQYGKICLRSVILILMFILTILLSQSTTSLFVVIVFVVFLLGFPYIRKVKYFSLILVFLIPLVISIAFVVFSFQENYEFLIEDTSDKDATFTGRVFIWEYALYKIYLSPVIGYGFHSHDEWNSIFCDFDRFIVSHPHNYILYSLVQGGFLYLILLLLLLVFITWFTWKKHQDANIYILTVMFFCFFVEGITESITECPLMYPMLGLFMPLSREKINKNYMLCK